MRLTDKDILLLKLAVSVLIVFLTVRFLVMPGIGRYQENRMNGRELDGTIKEMQTAIDGISELEQEVQERKEELKDISAQYYEQMENRQIDELLTGLALKAGLFPVSLSIGEAQAEIPQAYLYGKSSGLEDEEESADAESGEPISDGYVLTVNCTMVLQGSWDQAYQSIDDLEHNEPAIQVQAMHVSKRTYLDTDWNVVEQPEVSFELAVYMHKGI